MKFYFVILVLLLIVFSNLLSKAINTEVNNDDSLLIEVGKLRGEITSMRNQNISYQESIKQKYSEKSEALADKSVKLADILVKTIGILLAIFGVLNIYSFYQVGQIKKKNDINLKKIQQELNKSAETLKINIVKDYKTTQEEVEALKQTKCEYETTLLSIKATKEEIEQIKSDMNSRNLLMKENTYNTFFSRGVAYESNKNYDKAIESFNEALKIMPDMHDAWNAIGASYANKGDLKEALRCYREAVRIKPDMYEAWYNMGLLYSNQDNYDESIKCYLESLKFKPDFDDALGNLGWVYLESGNKTKANEYITKAWSINQKEGSVIMNLAHLDLIEGKRKEAIKNYRISLSIFETKDKFWKDFENDFKALKQYSITREEYDGIRKVIETSID